MALSGFGNCYPLHCLQMLSTDFELSSDLNSKGLSHAVLPLHQVMPLLLPDISQGMLM